MCKAFLEKKKVATPAVEKVQNDLRTPGIIYKGRLWMLFPFTM